jgi:hypothetical protein
MIFNIYFSTLMKINYIIYSIFEYFGLTYLLSNYTYINSLILIYIIIIYLCIILSIFIIDVISYSLISLHIINSLISLHIINNINGILWEIEKQVNINNFNFNTQ